MRTHAIARAPALLVAVLAATAAAGCGQRVAIDHWVPPDADIGGARALSITDAYGRDASVAAVRDAALDVAGGAPWFSHVQIDARLETDGVHVWLRNGAELQPGVLYVRLDVLEDNAVVHTVEDEAGIHESLHANTLVSLTVADRDGLILDELEVEGVHERSGPLDPWAVDNALAESALAAARGALALVTPRPTTESVPLDERDERVNEVLARHFEAAGEERLTRGEVAAKLTAVDGAPALWNRAVLLESIGDRAGALPVYEEAARHAGAADWYDEQLEAARERHDDARRLGLE